MVEDEVDAAFRVRCTDSALEEGWVRVGVESEEVLLPSLRDLKVYAMAQVEL